MREHNGGSQRNMNKRWENFHLEKRDFCFETFPAEFLMVRLHLFMRQMITLTKMYQNGIIDQVWSAIDRQLNYDHISDISLNCWGISRNCWAFGSTAGGSWAVNLGDGETHWQPWTMVELPNNCRIALNTLVKIQTMVVKIINTIVEISNSQMLKYMQDIQNSGGSLRTSWHLLL